MSRSRSLIRKTPAWIQAWSDLELVAPDKDEPANAPEKMTGAKEEEIVGQNTWKNLQSSVPKKMGDSRAICRGLARHDARVPPPQACNTYAS